jgi:hypothetical protein
MDVGPFLRVVIKEYAGIVFCYAVTMNLQQPSSRPFLVFDQLLATPAKNGENLVLGQLPQKETLS